MKREHAMSVVSSFLVLAVAGCDTIQVPGLNQDPTANAGPDASVVAGETVTLSAAGSADADGDSLSYNWTKTGGPSLALQVTNQKELMFVPEFGGTYEFTVTVTDGRGGSDNDTARVSVQGPADPTPPQDTPTPPPDPSPSDPPSPPDPSSEPRILVASTFDLDDEGWRISGNGKRTTAKWEAFGRGADGAISNGVLSKNFNGGLPIAYWDAPPEFLGDLSAAHGGTLSFETWIKTRSTIDAQLVILTGVDGSMLELPMPFGPGSGWTRFSVRLDDKADWTNSATGLKATNDEIAAVLSNLVQLRIRGEYPVTRKRSLGKLDNVIVRQP